jgi:hypothetical protein
LSRYRRTKEVTDLFRTRTQRIALLVSVLAHLILLLVWRPLSHIDLFPDKSRQEAAADVPLVFELVETPDDAIRQEPENAHLLSDKNALARDEHEGDIAKGEAYSEGEVPHRVFAGDPDAGGVQTAQSEEVQDQRQEDAESEPWNPILDWAGSYFDSKRSEDRDTKDGESSRLQPQVGPPSPQRRFTDDLNFEQRLTGADAKGSISLNTYEWDYASYILQMKQKLKSNIFPPAIFTYMGGISGETTLSFRVWPDGKVSDLTVIEFNGHRTLMETSVTAVEKSSPFRPLPANFPEEYLELRWTFYYYTRR